jgi:hypothetical protein
MLDGTAPDSSASLSVLGQLPAVRNSIDLAINIAKTNDFTNDGGQPKDCGEISIETLIRAASALAESGELARCDLVLHCIHSSHHDELHALPAAASLRVQVGVLDALCGCHDYAIDMLLPCFEATGQHGGTIMKAMAGLWRIQDALDVIQRSKSDTAMAVFGGLLRMLNRDYSDVSLSPEQTPAVLRAFSRITSLESNGSSAASLIQQVPADTLDALAVAICVYRNHNIEAAEKFLAQQFASVALVRSASSGNWLDQASAAALCNAAFSQRRGRIFPAYDLLRNIFVVRLMAPEAPLRDALAARYIGNRTQWQRLANGALPSALPSFMRAKEI